MKIPITVLFVLWVAFSLAQKPVADSLNPADNVRVKTSTGVIQITAADSSRAGALSASDKRKIDRIEVLSNIGELRNIPSRRTDVIYRLINSRLRNVSDLYWNPASTAQDDSVMVFKVPGVATGRFLR